MALGFDLGTLDFACCCCGIWIGYYTLDGLCLVYLILLCWLLS